MDQKVLTITQLNEFIRAIVDADPALSAISVCGEISNYKKYPSGHHYFTLKDENASLKCVMFKSNAVRLRFEPTNGMKIIAHGRISVYPRDGAYQLYCLSMIPDGVGDLHVAFEQLKTKLGKLGLFDTDHKKPIPKFPHTIGIITSSAGAAVHDILRILNKRWPIAKVRLLPVRVQGAEAPDEISTAIQYANIHKLADVLIVGRGGGSIEDLWAFNDEKVAFAIFNSTIPIISAVGHEPDVTISDYVADIRAATPSNAAELAVLDQDNMRQYLDQTIFSMASILSKHIKSARFHLKTLEQSSVLQSPASYLKQKRTQLQLISQRMSASAQNHIEKNLQRYIRLATSLDSMSPLKVLSRGYAMVNDNKSNVINSVHQLHVGSHIDITFFDGICSAEVTDIKETTHE